MLLLIFYIDTNVNIPFVYLNFNKPKQSRSFSENIHIKSTRALDWCGSVD